MKKRSSALLCCILLILFILIFTSCGQKAPEPAAPLLDPESVAENGEDKEDEPEMTLPKEPELPGAFLVMVDNYSKARPQSGLDKADLVYEMMAEGGITRFMALYYQQSAEKIGPVRSARYYFVQLARGYDSPLAHAGGSQEALQMLSDLKMKDLDEIYNAGGYFWRDKTRSMPHNLYTSTEQLQKGAKAKGYKLVLPPAFDVRTSDSADAGVVHAKEILIDYSTKTYQYVAGWAYNGKKYERSINGKPHLMEDGTALLADNLIFMVVPTKDIVKDKVLLSEIKIIGQGETCYYTEGKMTKGTWSKASVTGKMQFFDDQGKPVQLKPGQTWVQAIPAWSSMTAQE